MIELRFRFVFALLLVGVVGCQSDPRVEEGLDAYYQRDFQEAKQNFREAAEQGNPEAQTNLGILYYEGRVVRRDLAEAFKWFERAARQGEVRAQSYLGLMYRLGQGVKLDRAEGFRWYLQAALQGDSEMQFLVGRIYVAGDGAPKDEAEGLKWFEIAANQGHAEAREVLARATAVYGEDVVAEGARRAAEWEVPKPVRPTDLTNYTYASGIAVSYAGHILTTAKAASGCLEMRMGGKSLQHLDEDAETRLVLYRIPQPLPTAARISEGPPVEPDEIVYAAGFAPPGLRKFFRQAPELRVIESLSSGYYGWVETYPDLLITAKDGLSPSLRGGALLDGDGEVIGILGVAPTGEATQDVIGTPNPFEYVVSARGIRSFLDRHNVIYNYQRDEQADEKNGEQNAEKKDDKDGDKGVVAVKEKGLDDFAAEAVVKLECWK